MGLKMFLASFWPIFGQFWPNFGQFLATFLSILAGGSESFKHSRRGETSGIFKGIYSKGYPTSSARGPSYRSFGIAAHGPGNGSAGRRIWAPASSLLDSGKCVPYPPSPVDSTL